jgi:hypothetical protein
MAGLISLAGLQEAGGMAAAVSSSTGSSQQQYRQQSAVNNVPRLPVHRPKATHLINMSQAQLLCAGSVHVVS